MFLFRTDAFQFPLSISSLYRVGRRNIDLKLIHRCDAASLCIVTIVKVVRCYVMLRRFSALYEEFENWLEEQNCLEEQGVRAR